jgi:fumarate reductase subunit D
MDKLKLFWEMGIIWVIIMVILGIWSAFAFPGSLVAQAGTWIANVILIVLTVLNLYIYYKEAN